MSSYRTPAKPEADDTKPRRRASGPKRPEPSEPLGMRVMRFFPFIFLGVMLLGALALFAYGRWSAEPRALADCRAGASGPCVDLIRAWAALPEKRREAWTLATERCLANVYPACEELVALAKTREPAELPAVHRTLELGCDRGLEALCTLRGIESMGVDAPAARAWFLRACHQKDSVACTLVGEWMLEGRGGAKDRAEGLRYLDIACTLSPRQPGSSSRISDACDRLAREKLAGAP